MDCACFLKLGQGKRRYSDLKKKAEGIAKKMLTQVLRLIIRSPRAALAPWLGL